MKIAIEGCAHGELEIIYNTIKLLEEKQNFKIDLLICCGDFQATRNKHDLQTMAVPPKFYNMRSFYKYYNGEKQAPILTIFIGGNHEASNHLQELPYGGWVAPNIYYLGYAGVINVAGIRIGGLSGIYKGQDYIKGHFEKPPYSDGSKRSVYHVRNLEVFRLKQLSQPIDIFISHDWPLRIWNHGNCEKLLRYKPFFSNDIKANRLGSKPCEELLNYLQPQYWFSAHLHCKFAALVKHDGSDEHTTKFLALDKCLPRRRFLQILDIPHDPNLNIEISYDLEWLTILHLTNHLLSVKPACNFLPGQPSVESASFTPSAEQKEHTLLKFSNNLAVPLNFIKTVEAYNPQTDNRGRYFSQLQSVVNPQTTIFCETLKVHDPLLLLKAYAPVNTEGDTTASSDVLKGSETYLSSVKDSPANRSLGAFKLPPPKVPYEELQNIDSDKSSQQSSDIKPECSTESLSFLNYTSPLPKGLKRRNADLYSSSND